jgi:hypothetical protein
MSRFVAVTLALSIVGHALFLGLGVPRKREVPLAIEGRLGPIVMARTETFVRKHRASDLRQVLVAQARADRAKGTLQLGRFILDANRIDADEEEQTFEYEDALAKYENRLSDLRKVLEDEQFVVYAASSTFGDLRYHGRPGGRMGDALLDGGGSCEQVAQLVVAAAFDVGRGKEVAFRVDGQPGADGVAHLAPIGTLEGKDYDLMAGGPAALGGARVAPDELVEVYARVHGLAPPLEGAQAKSRTGATAGMGASATPQEPGRTSLASGFPPNYDSYPGSLPLYSERAIKSPTMAASEDGGLEDTENVAERVRFCAPFLRMASLSPVTVDVMTDGTNAKVSIEPVRTPNASRLEREARLLRAAEDLATNRYVDTADHLLAYACMVALGEAAAVDFSLAGERRIAALAMDTGRRAREGGKKLLADINWKSPEGVATTKRLRTDFAGHYWLLLFLEGGDDVVLDLARHREGDDWGDISSMAALLLYPNTRARALDLTAKYSKREQIDVMHELFHAHDHLRPWATNYEFSLPKDAGGAAQTFMQVYRVFRSLAFRLWEGQREPSETVDAFLVEAREAGLDMAWQAAIVDYYARNLLALYSYRNKGIDVMVALKRAMQYNTHPSLDLLRKQMALIEAEGRLDARTLADAFRQR